MIAQGDFALRATIHRWLRTLSEGVSVKAIVTMALYLPLGTV